jgi:EpsD family peptidyl-prolyl cis-trans isomerase
MTQVVAKVNGDEISVHTLNFQMSRLGNLTEEQGKKAPRDVLAKLVDQKLMVQKAEDGKLHRDPKVRIVCLPLFLS